MDPLYCFVGDIHAGSKRGLSAKPQTAAQTWLLETWAAFVRRVGLLSERHELYLMLGGDLVDSPGRDARNDALALLTPLASRARGVCGVPGTEYHVGDDGEEDRSIYDMLGAKVLQRHRLSAAGREFVWAHHALRVGGQPWTEHDGLYRSAKSFAMAAVLGGRPAPALVVGHHVHRSPGIGRYADTLAVVCPCWQLGTAFGAKVRPWSEPHIGGLLWWPAVHTLETVIYATPAEYASE